MRIFVWKLVSERLRPLVKIFWGVPVLNSLPPPWQPRDCERAKIFCSIIEVFIRNFQLKIIQVNSVVIVSNYEIYFTFFLLSGLMDYFCDLGCFFGSYSMEYPFPMICPSARKYAPKLIDKIRIIPTLEA